MHDFSRQGHCQAAESIYRASFLLPPVIFKLDDGTGVIECWKYYDTSDEATASLGLGDFIAAYGVLYIQNK